MNPKVEWRLWEEPTSENTFYPAQWGCASFSTRVQAEQHLTKTGGNNGMFWTWSVRKYPSRRK